MIAVALAGLAMLSPWLVRNYMLFHQFIPVRSGFGLELYIGNNGYSQRWVNSALHPNHSDAELSEYERVGEIAYMDHKLQQAKDYIRSHPALVCLDDVPPHRLHVDRLLEFRRAYLKDEPLDPPNIFRQYNHVDPGLCWACGRVFRRDRRWACVLPSCCSSSRLTYYFSHPETYYFRPVDPLIVVLAAVAVAGRSKQEGTPRQASELRQRGRNVALGIAALANGV